MGGLKIYLPISMYAFLFKYARNFSKHQRQHCNSLRTKSTTGPLLPRNLKDRKETSYGTYNMMGEKQFNGKGLP